MENERNLFKDGCHGDDILVLFALRSETTVGRTIRIGRAACFGNGSEPATRPIAMRTVS